MKLLPLVALIGLLLCHFSSAAEGDLVELLIVPVGNELKIFNQNPQIHSAQVKDGKVTFSQLEQIPGTDYVFGYTFVAQVRERGAPINTRSFSFFITFSSFTGFTEFGEGKRSPRIATGNLWNRLPSEALNGGWQSFPLLAPQAVQRQDAEDEPKPRKVGAMVFVRWSRPADGR